MKPPAEMPMMLIRMRCPSCHFDYRFGVAIDTPLMVLPEIAKQVMRCKCRNHIPKFDKNTPIENSLMSINAVPLKELKKRAIFNGIAGGNPTFEKLKPSVN